MTFKIPCILVGAIAATITSAQAVHTLGYDFDTLVAGVLGDGASIPNSGSVSGAGIFHVGSLGGTGTIVNTGVVPGTAYGSVDLGRTLTLTPVADGNASLAAPNIDTGSAVSLYGLIPSQTYSAFAWVNLATGLTDNMVFGGNGAVATPLNQVLHLGTRFRASTANPPGNDMPNVQSGHWGDDAGPDQGLFIPVPINQWNVIAFTNDGATGVQTIYINPGSPGEVSLSGGGPNNTGGMDRTINLLIGTAANGGSFNGGLDRVTTYDTLRTPAQLAAAATAAPIPEPASIVALVSGAGLLLMRRRRRSA